MAKVSFYAELKSARSSAPFIIGKMILFLRETI